MSSRRDLGERPPPPDPGRPQSLDEFVDALKSLWNWAGNPSYRVIAKRISAEPGVGPVSHSTVADIFKIGRRRFDMDLIVQLLRALGLHPAQVTTWRDACIGAHAATQRSESVEALRQLPSEPSVFVGRERELAELLRWAADGRATAGPTVVAVEGMAGIGKTQFAIRAANELVRHGLFADAQLFTNLRGFDRQRAPIDPAEILDSFLRRLGVPGSRIPADLDGRAALYRDRLSGKGAIVVLDNVANEEQVRDLLPTDSHSLVIMTSRRSLAGLPDVRHVTLPLLTPDEALGLLRSTASPDKINAAVGAANRIAELCGHLPIAVALAAQRLRARTAWTVENLADYLAVHGLDGFAAGGSTVRAMFDLSYRELSPTRQRHYRLLALHPGDVITPGTAAALAGVDAVSAQALLEDLLDQNLLQQRSPGSYEFHDLLRAYAADLLARSEDDGERDGSLTRLFDHCVGVSSHAVGELYPYRRPERPAVPADYFPHSDARAWLDKERANLLTVARTAAENGWPRYAVDLAGILTWDLQAGGHFAANEQLQKSAVAAARGLGDRAGESRALLNLGSNYAWTSFHTEALDCLGQALAGFYELGDRRAEAEALSSIGISYDMSSRLLDGVRYYKAALTLFGEVGDHAGQGRVMCNLGFAYERLGHYEQSLVWSRRALEALRTVNARVGAGRALTNIGRSHAWRGEFDEAYAALTQALTISRETGDRTGEGAALSGLAFRHDRAGRPADALPLLTEALAIFQSTGNRADECRATSRMGGCLLAMGEVDQALDLLEQALRNSRTLGDRVIQGAVLNDLGAAMRALGRADRARQRHREALELASATVDRYELGRAHQGIAAASHDLGDLRNARSHWREALLLFNALDLPQAARVRSALAQLAAP